MTDQATPAARTPKQAIRRRLPKRRDDSGLTTLEWLLIVAAVAGLAALAVVLVRNVVTQTAEELEGSTARLTTAELEADRITQDALAYPVSDQGDIDEANRRGMNRCENMKIAFKTTFENATPQKTTDWTDGEQPTAANVNNSYGDSGETPPLCEIVNA